MGFYVHISITFPCDESVTEIASKYISKLTKDTAIEVRWYLTDLLSNDHIRVGPKGGLSTWGLVSNHTDVESIAKTLSPFWEELLRSECGPHDFEHIIFFYEKEQSEQACCYEAYLDNDIFILKHHKLPFCWNQM